MLLIVLIGRIIWFLYFLSSVSQSPQWPSWEELKAKELQMKCEAKAKKQWYIDTANFQDSLKIKTWKPLENSWYLYDWSFVWPDKINLELAEINLILSWKPVDCTGVTYDKINLNDILWFIAPKVHANEPTIEDKIKWNSAERIRIDNKKKEYQWKIERIIRKQNELHEENNKLRAKLNLLDLDFKAPMTVISDANMRDTKKTCKVWDKKVSINSIVYALVMQEWGRREWTAGYSTKNWWSIRVDHGVVPIVKYHHVDSTKTRIEYKTVNDWLYHLSYIVSEKYNCNYGRASIFAYVYWPRAKKTQARISHTTAMWNNFVKNVNKYESTFTS